MKRLSKNIGYLILAVVMFSVIFFSCKNPLVSVIDDEVDLAITPPEVLTVFPDNQDDNVPISLSTIIVTFSKNIDPSSVNADTFAVSHPNSASVSGSRDVEEASITFSPNSDLSVGTVYSVVINGVLDIDGNSISEIYTWSFTTGIEGDTVRPVISAVSVNNGSLWTNSRTVDVSVDATDNFGIAQMNVSTTGNFSDAGWINWAETFSLDLPEGDGQKNIYLKLKDGSGLETASFYQTTIGLDTTLPEVALFSLDGGNSGTKNSAVSVDIFGVDENGGSGVSEYRLHTEGAEWSDWDDLNDGGISLSDQALTVSTNETETFYLQVRDNALNESDIEISAITYDFTPPAVDLLLSNPIPGSTDNRIKSYIKVVFTEEMDTGTIDNSSIFVTKGTERISTEVYELVDDKTAIEFTEFNLLGSSYILEQNTGYNVFISGSVSDVAGNTIVSDYTYTFHNDAFIDSTAPAGKIVLDLDTAEVNATPLTTFDLMIQADDDYNGVRAVKIWGDNDGSGFPTFESEAAWKLYAETLTTVGGISYMSYDAAFSPPSGGWDLLSNDGDHYIYYKFIDYANNESETPGVLRISLDTTDPVLNGLQIDDGTGFSNNTGDTVNLIIDSEDLQSGLQNMWVSVDASSVLNMPASDSGSWEDWSPLKPDISLASGEGKYYIYAETRDFVGNESSLQDGDSNDVYASVILDYTNPEVSFNATDYLVTNTLSLQTVSYDDLHPLDTQAYHIPSGPAFFEWEQVSGPAGGTVTFYEDMVGTVNSSYPLPWVSAGADDGSQDGTYELKLTVTDYAGNSAYDIVEFVWDTIDPMDVGLLSAFNDDDSALNTSAADIMVYTPSARPYVTWDAPAGADFYTVIPWFEELDPNIDPGVAFNTGGWYPHWDDDEVDMSDSSSYGLRNYIYSEAPFVSAPAPDEPGDNDGAVYFYVASWDDAGNRSNRLSNQMVQFWIDTLPPIVENLQVLNPSNEALTIDYNNSSSGDGYVYDQRTAISPVPGTQGTGIESYLWEQTSGPGTLNIAASSSLDPTVSAALDGSEDGEYELKLSVTDLSGNVGEGYISFIWDTTAPGAVVVSGNPHTPDLTPTWSWSSGGGGNGQYEYKLMDGSTPLTGNVSTEYWETTTDNFYTPSALTDDKTYTLFVREYDDAGNVSDEDNPVSSFDIWADLNFTSEPSITRDGLYLRNAGDRSVSWSWSSGLATATERYGYRVTDSAGDNIIPITQDAYNDLGDNVANVTIDFSAYDDDVYTIEVREYNQNNSWIDTGKHGTSNVQIDATAPIKPIINLSSTTGADTPTSYDLTNDTTPYFRWSSGGGGGYGYRWSFDESSWTNTNSVYVTTSNAEGLHTFYVQESDLAGNWSASSLFYLEIDTTAPSLQSILLENRSVNAVNTTSYTVSTSVDVTVDGSGTNAETYTSNDIQYMRFWNSGGTAYLYNYNTDLYGWNFANGGASSADGTKYVYCELIDYAGNVSVSRSDAISLDTAEPVVSSFSINNGATTTSSASATLNSTYSGANYMRISTDGGSTWQGWYSATSSKAWTLNTVNGYNGYGAKKVLVQFTDYAGLYSRNLTTQQAAHYTQVDDSIFYGTPVMSNSYKGLNQSGYIRTHYESYPSDTGSSNVYYIYYATSPTGGKTEKGTTTSSSSFSDYYTEGVPYYLFVRVYNPDIGWSNYSSYSLGFSSNITIIYDDDDSDDTALANTIKSWIQRDWASQYSTIFMQGSYTWSEYSVTLVPEDEVSTAWLDDGYDETIIYGDPTIITPSAANLYANTNRAKNVVKSNHGIFAMHYFGWRFLQTVANNWSAFEMSGTSPSDLDYAYNKGDTQYANIKPYYSQYDYIWHKYMYNSGLWDNYKYTEDYDNLMFTTSTTSSTGLAHRWSIYNSNSSGTNGTYFYADDPDYANYYTVARQGEFVYWAYDKMPAYVNGGMPFFYNIIRNLTYY